MFFSIHNLALSRKLYFFLHTAQEILNNHFLNEMGPVTLSSMDMKLQELLNEVRLNESSVKTLDEFVTVICDSIRSIPDDTIKVTSESIPKFISDIGAPTEKIRFTFRTPKVVEVAGSHSIQAVTKPEVNVDLLIRMPKVALNRFCLVLSYFFWRFATFHFDRTGVLFIY